MQVKCNDNPVDNLQNGITLDVQVDPSGEDLPEVNINVHGGRLDVYRSRVHQNGNIKIHYFGADGQKVTMDLADILKHKG